MQTEIKFAGFGGQGILVSAKLLAYAAMKQDYFVAWVPSYGPEMRGGTAYCTVVISDRRIGSPIIKNPSHLVAMNLPSLEKFAPEVKPGGILLINSSLISSRSGRNDIIELIVPANDAAIQLGNVRCANIIALSAMASKINIIDLKILKKCIKEEFSNDPHLASIDEKAFAKGLIIAKSQ